MRRSRTSLGEGSRRLKKRRGRKRAALAVGQRLLVISYQLRNTGEASQEKGKAFFVRNAHGNVEQQWVRRLERLALR